MLHSPELSAKIVLQRVLIQLDNLTAVCKKLQEDIRTEARRSQLLEVQPIQRSLPLQNLLDNHTSGIGNVDSWALALDFLTQADFPNAPIALDNQLVQDQSLPIARGPQNQGEFPIQDLPDDFQGKD